MIVDYEMTQKIPIDDDCDFEVDDEIVNEEEFLRIIDEELDGEASNDQEIQTEDNNEDTGECQTKAKDQGIENLDEISSPSTDQSQFVADQALKQAKKIIGKMENIAVAPGEFGGFQNWGKDNFLEGKCFPEKFPFGTGGYLS